MRQLSRRLNHNSIELLESRAEGSVGGECLRRQPARLGNPKMILQEAVQTPEESRPVVDHRHEAGQDDLPGET